MGRTLQISIVKALEGVTRTMVSPLKGKIWLIAIGKLQDSVQWTPTPRPDSRSIGPHKFGSTAFLLVPRCFDASTSPRHPPLLCSYPGARFSIQISDVQALAVFLFAVYLSVARNGNGIKVMVGARNSRVVFEKIGSRLSNSAFGGNK